MQTALTKLQLKNPHLATSDNIATVIEKIARESELDIFSVESNKAETVKNNDEETVIRILKGTTITRADRIRPEIRGRSHYVLMMHPTQKFYDLVMEAEYHASDWNAYTTHNTDLTRVALGHSTKRLDYIPEDKVEARLSVEHVDSPEEYAIVGVYGKDPIIERILQSLTEKV